MLFFLTLIILLSRAKTRRLIRFHSVSAGIRHTCIYRSTYRDNLSTRNMTWTWDTRLKARRRKEKRGLSLRCDEWSRFTRRTMSWLIVKILDELTTSLTFNIVELKDEGEKRQSLTLLSPSVCTIYFLSSLSLSFWLYHKHSCRQHGRSSYQLSRPLFSACLMSSTDTGSCLGDQSWTRRTVEQIAWQLCSLDKRSGGSKSHGSRH